MNPPNYLQRQRLDDLYVAELTSLEDPLRLGRVQVRVFGFSDELPEDSLPWAEWHLPLGAGINRGTVPVMKVGDRVQVRFVQGDGRYPVVVGSALTATNREVQLPAIGIDGPRSTAGIRVTPPEVPTSQSLGVPYLSDEVSLQHDILIQRRSNRSYRVAHMLQGSQFEMTSTGAIALHSPQAIWFSTQAEIQSRFSAQTSKGGEQQTELSGQYQLNASKIVLESVSHLNVEAGGELKLSGLKASLSSLGGVGVMSGSGLTMISGQSMELMASTGYQLRVALNDIEMETVLGSVFLRATPIGPSMKLNPLEGFLLASPLATVGGDLVGNLKAETPTVSFEMTAQGSTELKTPQGSLSMSLSGKVSLKNMTAEVTVEERGSVKVANQADSLGRILQELMLAIQNIDVQTGTGRSSKILNIAEIQAISRRLQNLLS